MMPTEEKTMKIKAKFDDEARSYKAGGVLEAKFLEYNHYIFYDNDGDSRYRHESEFTLLPDEHAIEVGSVWLNSHGHELTVNYASKEIALCTWNHNGKEFASPLKNHLKFYKPKPKTVTMYFYEENGSFRAYDSPCIINFHVKPVAFTREIELP